MGDDKGPIEQMNEEMNKKTPMEAIGDDFGAMSASPEPTDEEEQALDDKVENAKEQGA